MFVLKISDIQIQIRLIFCMLNSIDSHLRLKVYNKSVLTDFKRPNLILIYVFYYIPNTYEEAGKVWTLNIKDGQKNVYRQKTAITQSTFVAHNRYNYILHTSLEAKFYQNSRSYFKIKNQPFRAFFNVSQQLQVSKNFKKIFWKPDKISLTMIGVHVSPAKIDWVMTVFCLPFSIIVYYDVDRFSRSSRKAWPLITIFDNSLLGGKSKGEKNNQSRGQKSYLSAWLIPNINLIR